MSVSTPSASLLLAVLAVFVEPGGLLAAPAADGSPDAAGRPARSVYERCVALAEAVVARHPGKARVLLELGAVHFRQGRFTEALAIYDRILRTTAANGSVRQRRALCCWRLGRTEEAIADYRRALADGSPDSTRVRLELADVLYQAARQQESAVELRALLRTGRGGGLAHYHLGRALNALLLEGDLSADRTTELRREAIATLQRAAVLRPAHAQTRYLLGMLLRRGGDAQGAREHLRAYRRLKQPGKGLDPGKLGASGRDFEIRAAVGLARAVFESGAAGDALQLVEHALRVDPDAVEAHSYRGWIHLQQKRFPRAEAAYKEALSRDPGHAESLWNLGKVHLRTGSVQRGAELLLDATERKGHFPDGWEMLTLLARQKGVMKRRTLEFSRKALAQRKSPKNFAAHAQCLFEAGRRQDAEQVLESGLRRFRGDPTLSQALVGLRGARLGE